MQDTNIQDTYRVLVVGQPNSNKEKSAQYAKKNTNEIEIPTNTFSLGQDFLSRANAAKLGSPGKLGEPLQASLHSGYLRKGFALELDKHFTRNNVSCNGIITTPLYINDTEGIVTSAIPIEILPFLKISRNGIINIVGDDNKMAERNKGSCHSDKTENIFHVQRMEYQRAKDFAGFLGHKRVISVPEYQAGEAIAKRIIDKDRYSCVAYCAYPISYCKDQKLIEKIDSFHKAFAPYSIEIIPMRMVDKKTSTVNDKQNVVKRDKEQYIYGNDAVLVIYYPDKDINSHGVNHERIYATELGREVHLIDPGADPTAFGSKHDPRLSVYKDEEQFFKKLEEVIKDPENPEYSSFHKFLTIDFKKPRYHMFYKK